jgi:hypothetical protein
MSEHQLQDTKAASTDHTRRRFVQAALATSPVIATITSRPVQAVQGLSNMMSGNASDCRGDEFYGGMSPGFWKTPTGTTDAPYADRARKAWTIAGYNYGKWDKTNKKNKWDSYTGGTPFNTVFGGGDTRSLREVLNAEPGSDEFHLIAGLLNASYFQNKAGAGRSLYFLTPDQYWDLLRNPGKVPMAYSSLRNLIETNYHFGPNSDCEEVISNY